MQTSKLQELYLKECGKMLADKKQVFVVDDDVSVCRALGILLCAHGFMVGTYISAEKFFSAVPDNVQGCLVMDIHMPGLDGWEALRRVVKSGSKRPVIIMSADRNGGINERALRSGAVGYLQKPFNDQALINLINIMAKGR
jgi:two-component system response regulator FixJ